MASKSSENSKNPTGGRDAEEALFESQAGGVIDVLDQRRNQLLIGIIVVAVVVCAVLSVRQIKIQKNLKAGAAFSEAAAKKDIPALDAVLVEFPGSTAAGDALLTEADILIDRGKAKDAQATLESFVKDFKDHPRHAQGLFALANLQHVTGDREKAKSYYEQALADQPAGELAPLTMIRLGDLSLEAGDNDVADQYYQDSFIDHPGNSFTQLAKKKIALLKVGNPPVVDPPKPPAPPKKQETAAQPDGKTKPAGDTKKDKSAATKKPLPGKKKTPTQPKPAAKQPKPPAAGTSAPLPPARSAPKANPSPKPDKAGVK